MTAEGGDDAASHNRPHLPLQRSLRLVQRSQAALQSEFDITSHNIVCNIQKHFIYSVADFKGIHDRVRVRTCSDISDRAPKAKGWVPT